MAKVGKRGNYLVVLTEEPEKEYECSSTCVIDIREKDVDEIWFKILNACDSSDYFFIYVNDKAGFFHDDGELPYEIYELVEACHRGDAELFGLRLKSGKFFYQDECMNLHNFVEGTCNDGEILAHYD